MSDTEVNRNQNPYAVSGPPRANAPVVAKPVTALVFGIINSIFGVLGLIGSLIAIAIMVLSPDMWSFPVDAAGFDFEALQNANFAAQIAAFPLSVLLVASAVGLLRYRNWGRILANLWAVLSMVSFLINMVFMASIFYGPISEAMGSTANSTNAGLVGGIIGGTIGSCASLIHPLLTLIFMNRSSFVRSLKYTEQTQAVAAAEP